MQHPATASDLAPAGRTRTLSIKETADQLRVSTSTVYDLINRGKLKVLRLGRRTLVTTESIDELMREAA